MASKLERALRQDRLSNGNIRNTLCNLLDDGTSLYCMRAASSTIRDSVDLTPENLWGTLYMYAPLRSDKIFLLDRISPNCHTLIITVQTPTRKPERERSSVPLGHESSTYDRPVSNISALDLSQDLGDYEVDRNLWAYVFKRFRNLVNLTLRIDGDPAWPGRGEVETAIVTLRCALERAGLRTLRSLSLHPVHIFGIIHLRWEGFGAMYEVASPRTCANLWQSIAVLDLRLRNPMYTNKLTASQIRMSTKILQDYLRSFAPTLRYLRFVWLDGDGPSPILLDEEAGMENIRRVFWPALEEFHFGNIHTPHKTIQVISERAPDIRVVKALRSTHRSSRMDPEDREAWIDIEIDRSRRRRVADSRASSIYSQDGADF